MKLDIKVGNIKKKQIKVNIANPKPFKEDRSQRNGNISSPGKNSNKTQVASVGISAATTSVGTSVLGDVPEKSLDVLAKELGLDESSSASEYEYFDDYMPGFSMTGYELRQNLAENQFHMTAIKDPSRQINK